MSTWGWAQNSLVSVDDAAKSFRYNHDYYLMKHLSHFVEVGAKRVETTGTCDDALGFVNPDGTVVLLLRNASPQCADGGDSCGWECGDGAAFGGFDQYGDCET